MLITDGFREDFLDETISQYRDDIPKPDLVFLEIRNLRQFFLEMEEKRVPQTISGAMFPSSHQGSNLNPLVPPAILTRFCAHISYIETQSC